MVNVKRKIMRGYYQPSFESMTYFVWCEIMREILTKNKVQIFDQIIDTLKEQLYEDHFLIKL